MELTAPVVKYAAPPAAAAAAVEGAAWVPTPLILIAVAIGLLFGAMWRVSFMRETKKSTWAEVKDDLLNSAFTIGANAVLAVAAVAYIQGGVLAALVIGVVIGGTGVRALMWLQRQVFKENNDNGQH